MEDENEAYYVVRIGDIVGVYRSLSDCQSLLCGPDVAVFKGYRLSNDAEKYLASHGLSRAIYSIGASNVQSDLFGQLTHCPYKQPLGSKAPAEKKMKQPPKAPADKMKKDVGSTPLAEASQRKMPETESFIEALPVSAYCKDVGPTPFAEPSKRPMPENKSFIEALPVSAYCCSGILEFDGAAKGNPGPAGAGAVLRAADGSLVYRLREGLGVATNNVAEYRAMILGLRYALERGFRHIRVQGDSKLVCMQVNGLWKTKNQNMADLCKVAKELKEKFLSFEICHIERALNSEADAQANLGVLLQNGEVQEEVERR